MYIDFDGHHSGGSSFVYIMIFVITKIVCIPTGTSSALRKKKQVKSPSIYSRASELGSDPPFGSDLESGCDNNVFSRLRADKRVMLMYDVDP